MRTQRSKTASLFPSFNFTAQAQEFEDEIDQFTFRITKLIQYFSQVVRHFGKKEKKMRAELECATLEKVMGIGTEVIEIDYKLVTDLLSMAIYMNTFIREKSDILEKYWKEIKDNPKITPKDPYREVIKALNFEKEEALSRLKALERRQDYLSKREVELEAKSGQIKKLKEKLREGEENNRIMRLKISELKEEIEKKDAELEKLNSKIEK